MLYDFKYLVAYKTQTVIIIFENDRIAGRSIAGPLHMRGEYGAEPPSALAHFRARRHSVTGSSQLSSKPSRIPIPIVGHCCNSLNTNTHIHTHTETAKETKLKLEQSPFRHIWNNGERVLVWEEVFNTTVVVVVVVCSSFQLQASQYYYS